MGVRGQYVFLLTLDKGHFITAIVCWVILFIEHEHILPKKAPHPLRIRCLFLFLDCQKFNSPLSGSLPLFGKFERITDQKLRLSSQIQALIL